MTNKFIQHIPSFINGVEPKSFEFNTQNELIVRLFEMGYGVKGGTWFEVSGNLIIEVSEKGYNWWVAGRVKSLEGLSFNKWQPKEGADKLLTRSDPPLMGGKTYNAKEVPVTINGKVLTGFADYDKITTERMKANDTTI